MFWGREESLAPAGIRTPDRPARSQRLYRLPYLVSFRMQVFDKNAQHHIECVFEKPNVHRTVQAMHLSWGFEQNIPSQNEEQQFWLQHLYILSHEVALV